MLNSNAYWQARILLAQGQPLPVDLMARLEAEGYDLTALQSRYAL